MCRSCLRKVDRLNIYNVIGFSDSLQNKFTLKNYRLRNRDLGDIISLLKGYNVI